MFENPPIKAEDWETAEKENSNVIQFKVNCQKFRFNDPQPLFPHYPDVRSNVPSDQRE